MAKEYKKLDNNQKAKSFVDLSIQRLESKIAKESKPQPKSPLYNQIKKKSN